MKRRVVLLQVSLVVALTFTVAVAPALAARPGGYRDLQDFALADFEQPLGGGIQAYLNVVYTEGVVQSPLGSGKPGAFADVVVTLRVVDTETSEVLSWAQGLTPGLSSTFSELEEATLEDVTVTLYDESGTPVDTAHIELSWHGNDDAAPRIDHQLAGDYLRQERFVTATLAGSVELDGGLSFGPDDAFGAVIGTANEVSLS